MRVFRINKINNKGNTLINVIVTLGFIGILASLVLVITGNNVLMKLVDKDSKENFYSAESAMEVVEAGLQIDMSVSMLDAYYAIIGSYEDYIGETDKLIDDFNKFVMTGVTTTYDGIVNNNDGFIARVKTDSSLGNTGVINIDHINDYFLTADFDGTVEVSGKNGDITYNVDTEYAYMTIKGLSVKYKNNGYEDTITTDIFIKVPTPDYSLFETESPNSAFNKYAIISNKNILSKRAGNNASITGSVWAGNSIQASNGANIDFESDCVYAGGINFNGYESNGSRLTASINKYGGILAGNDSSKLVFKKEGIYNSTIATRNMIVDSILNIDGGNCYVTNNLLLRKNNSVAKITGSYFGTGPGLTSYSSSSIIVSRKAASEDSGLTMRLKTLSIEGSAYIKPYNFGENFEQDGEDDIAGTEILTGESVAVSGNQVAYLVPIRFTEFESNPITRDEYDDFKKPSETSEKTAYEKFKIAYDAAVGGNAKPESEYIAEYIANEIANKQEDVFINCGLIASGDKAIKKRDIVKTVYYKPNYYNGEGVVYFYLNFSATANTDDDTASAITNASRYYASSVVNNSSREKIGTLINSNIDIESDNYLINGNYVTKSGSAGYTFNEKTTNRANGEYERIEYLRYYLQDTLPINTTLYEYTPTTSNTFDSYGAIDNIIDIALINECMTNSDVDSEGYIMNTTDDNYSAVVIDGDYEVNSDYTGIILATGNVTVNNSKVRGIIVSCNGDVILNGTNAKVISDESMVATMINRSATYKTNNGVKLSDFFKINAAESNSEEAIVSMDGMVTYENWTRE